MFRIVQLSQLRRALRALHEALPAWSWQLVRDRLNEELEWMVLAGMEFVEWLIHYLTLKLICYVIKELKQEVEGQKADVLKEEGPKARL